MEMLLVYLDDLFYYFVRQREHRIFLILASGLFAIDVLAALIFSIGGLAMVYAMLAEGSANIAIIIIGLILGVAGLILGWRIPKWAKLLFNVKVKSRDK